MTDTIATTNPRPPASQGLGARPKFKSKKFAGTEDTAADMAPKPKADKVKKGKKAAKSEVAAKIVAAQDDVKAKLDGKKGKAPKAAKPVEKVKGPSKSERDAARAANIPAPTVTVKGNMAPGLEIATELDRAFAYLNDKLFNDKVEPCVVVVSKLKRSYGHFWHSQFARRSDLKNNVHEIGIDFARLSSDGEGSDIKVLSTIAHEMAHALVYQIDKSEAAKSGKEFKPKTYHCGTWAALMVKIGLTPVAVNNRGEPTGKQTGPNATHTIDKGGAFETVAKELLATGFKFNWSMVGGYYDELGRPVAVKVGKGGKMTAVEGGDGEGGDKPKRKLAGAKAAHVCPHCNGKAYGKPSLVIHCKGTKDEPHDTVEMECDREAYEEKQAPKPEGEGDDEDAE